MSSVDWHVVDSIEETVGDLPPEPSFAQVFSRRLAQYGPTVAELARRPLAPTRSTLDLWIHGRREPYSRKALAFIAGLEPDWRLPDGYFKGLLSRSPRHGLKPRKVRADALVDLPDLAGGVLNWHLPDDFHLRSRAEQMEISQWIRRTLCEVRPRRNRSVRTKRSPDTKFDLWRHVDYGSITGGDRPEFSRRTHAKTATVTVWISSPPELIKEWEELVSFKTAPFSRVGLHRRQTWGAHSVEKAATVIGGLLGRLSDPRSAPPGISFDPLPSSDVSMAYLALPQVWDLTISERIAAQGGVSSVEKGLLTVAMSLVAPGAGWIRQRSDLAHRLRPIPGLVDDAEVEQARASWSETCDRCLSYAQTRMQDVDRERDHPRDHFQGVGVVLDAPAPMAEYRKITEEIHRRLPDRSAHSMAWAEAFRSFVMIRLAMHTGLRQRNLRELLFCPVNHSPRTFAELSILRRGELRWRSDLRTWEIFIPPKGFKNGHSAFFEHGPYRTQLPDHGDLYQHIDDYLQLARPLIIGPEGALSDTFLVKRPWLGSTEINKESFYRIWRQAIAKHGVYNRWTGKGALAGLRPHGPHALRAVLATHLLKITRSYEIAGYAIQDLPETVESAYGRFLPSDKSAIVTDLLSGVWQQTPIVPIAHSR